MKIISIFLVVYLKKIVIEILFAKKKQNHIWSISNIHSFHSSINVQVRAICKERNCANSHLSHTRHEWNKIVLEYTYGQKKMYGQTGQIGKWTTMPIAHMREPRIEANSSHSPTFVRSKYDLSLPQNGKRVAKRACISIVWICKEGWAEMEKILSHYTFVTTINNNKGCMLTHSSNIRHAKRYKENQPFFNLDAVFWFVLTRNESHCISRDTHSIHPIIRGQLAQNELAFYSCSPSRYLWPAHYHLPLRLIARIHSSSAQTSTRKQSYQIY